MEKKVKKQATSPLNRMSAWMSGFVQTADKVLSAEKGESKTGKDALVDFLKTTPEALDAFEKAYRKEVIDDNDYSYDGVPNAKQAAAVMNRETPEALDELVCRIVEELIALTPVYRYDGENISTLNPLALPDHEMVTKEEVMAVPAAFRPACTGNLMKKDCNTEEGVNGRMLLSMYMDSQSQKRSRTARKQAYDRFRSGLDLLDLDGLMYAMIDKNPNSMGYWLPALVEAVKKQDYFKIPATTMIKVPLTLLQLTRLDYGTHTPTTLKIVDDYCYRGAVIGFAAQAVLADVIAGMVLSFAKPFDVGERIVLENMGIAGIVENITMRHTVIRAYDGSRVLVPNSVVNKQVLRNSNFDGNVIGTFLEISVAYEADLERAIQVVKEAVLAEPAVVDKSKGNGEKEISVLLSSMNDSGCVIKTTIWTETVDESFRAASNIRLRIIREFTKERIEIPYPHVSIAR